MKISRGAYEEMFEWLHTDMNDTRGDARILLNKLLKIANIEVGAEPVLPFVCNELHPQKYDDYTYIFAEGKTTRVGEVDGRHQKEVERDAYARLFCAAPKLAAGMYDAVAAYDDSADVIHIDIHIDKFRTLLEEAGVSPDRVKRSDES